MITHLLINHLQILEKFAEFWSEGWPQWEHCWMCECKLVTIRLCSADCQAASKDTDAVCRVVLSRSLCQSSSRCLRGRPHSRFRSLFPTWPSQDARSPGWRSSASPGSWCAGSWNISKANQPPLLASIKMDLRHSENKVGKPFLKLKPSIHGTLQ